MLVIPGAAGKTPATASPAATSSALAAPAVLGLTPRRPLAMQKATANNEGDAGGGPGFGKAKSVILIYLQGGPSHLDLWDPKDNVPDKVKSVFKPIRPSCPASSSPSCCRSSPR